MANLTAKQEAFVQAYMRTSNQRQAYREAYDAENMSDAAVDVNACKLMKNAKVAIRLKVLYAQDVEKTGYTRSRIASMYQKAYDGAVANEQHGAAVAAASGIAKLYGMNIEKPKQDDTQPRNVTQINITASVSAVDGILADISRRRTEGDDVSPVGAGRPLLSARLHSREN